MPPPGNNRVKSTLCCLAMKSEEITSAMCVIYIGIGIRISFFHIKSEGLGKTGSMI